MARPAVAHLVREGANRCCFGPPGKSASNVPQSLGGTVFVLESIFHHLRALSDSAGPEFSQHPLPAAKTSEPQQALLCLEAASSTEAWSFPVPIVVESHPSAAGLSQSSCQSSAQQEEVGHCPSKVPDPVQTAGVFCLRSVRDLATWPFLTDKRLARPAARVGLELGGKGYPWVAGNSGSAGVQLSTRGFSASATDRSSASGEELGARSSREGVDTCGWPQGVGQGPEQSLRPSSSLGPRSAKMRGLAMPGVRAQDHTCRGFSAEVGTSSSLLAKGEELGKGGYDARGEQGGSAEGWPGEGGGRQGIAPGSAQQPELGRPAGGPGPEQEQASDEGRALQEVDASREETPGLGAAQGREEQPSGDSQAGQGGGGRATSEGSQSDRHREGAPALVEEAPAGSEPPGVSTEEHRRKAATLAQAIVAGGLDHFWGPEGQEAGTPGVPGEVPVEQQRSLRVGIIGAPNAGKSVFTNTLVGSKVSIVSRKTNTTRMEILGVATRGATQLLLYDTPGATPEIRGQVLKVANQKMVARTWRLSDSCEVVLLLVDAERQIRRPDARVKMLVERVGSELPAGQKRVACLNKVDLVKDKRQLLPLAQWLQEYHAFDRVFMTSGLKGSGLRELEDYLLAQAVLRPWEEDPSQPSGLSPQEVALETVREAVLDRLHEELPYTLEQLPVSWRTLTDGSLRIEQLMLVASETQRAMVVGQQGQTVRQIGINARTQLEELFKRRVHLILNVKVKPKR